MKLTILLTFLTVTSSFAFYLTKLNWFFTSNYHSAITAQNVKAGDWFADSLAATNDTLAVGAFKSDIAGEDAGAVYLFTHHDTGWRQSAELLARDAQPDDQMGFDVLVQDNTVAVGSVGKFEDPPSDISRGRVVIFEESTEGWKHTQTLVAEDGKPGDLFGYSLASNDKYLFIGAKNASTAESNEKSGAVYVFSRSSWTQVARLTAPDAAAGDRFGTAILLIGDELFVSATNARNDTGPSGRVYIFNLSGGVNKPTLADVLAPPPGSESEYFGVSVKGIAKNLAIGSSHWAAVELGGAVHTYRKTANQWSFTGRLNRCGGKQADMFGFRLAMSEDVLLASEHLADVEGTDSGSVSIFTFDEDQERWKFKSRFAAPDGHRNDHFGISMAIASDTLIVGAERADVNGKESGAMYMLPFDTLSSKTSSADTHCDSAAHK